MTTRLNGWRSRLRVGYRGRSHELTVEMLRQRGIDTSRSRAGGDAEIPPAAPVEDSDRSASRKRAVHLEETTPGWSDMPDSA